MTLARSAPYDAKMYFEAGIVVAIRRRCRSFAAAFVSFPFLSLAFRLSPQALYPAHFGVFVRASEEWSDCPEVTTSLMKFMMEFVYNKVSRDQIFSLITKSYVEA